MIFIVIVLSIWGLYAYILKKRKKEKFRFHDALLPLLLFSLLITIDLGVSYLSSYHIQTHDGIGIDGIFSYAIIGEDKWSIETFRGYFRNSMIVDLILLGLYAVLRIIED